MRKVQVKKETEKRKIENVDLKDKLRQEMANFTLLRNELQYQQGVREPAGVGSLVASVWRLRAFYV